MASVEKKVFWNRSTGKATVSYYVKTEAGRKHKALPGGFARKHDAEVAMGRMLAEQVAGTFGQESPEAVKFSDFADRWLRDYASLKKGSTQDDYGAVVRRHLNPYFGDMDLRSISPADVQRFVTAERDAGYSPRTVNKAIVVAKMMFRHAVKWGFWTPTRQWMLTAPGRRGKSVTT